MARPSPYLQVIDARLWGSDCVLLTRCCKVYHYHRASREQYHETMRLALMVDQTVLHSVFYEQTTIVGKTTAFMLSPAAYSYFGSFVVSRNKFRFLAAVYNILIKRTDALKYPRDAAAMTS